MKNHLLTLAIASVCSFAYSQTPAPLPPESADLIAKYKRWEEGEQKVLETKAKSLAVITALLEQKQDATRKGNSDGALAVEQEVKLLKERDEREGLLELMAGEWEWNTGSKVKFDQAGKTLGGDLVLWVINPGKRLLYYRTTAPDWHYDIVLSEDGDTFTAKRIQSGKE